MELFLSEKMTSSMSLPFGITGKRKPKIDCSPVKKNETCCHSKAVAPLPKTVCMLHLAGWEIKINVC